MRSLRHFLWLFILVIAASVPGQRGDAGGLELVVQTGHPYGVSAIAFTSDSRLAASGDNDGTVKLWDMATRRELRVFKGHTRFLTEIVFSNDGRLLATVQSGDPLLILWEVETGRKRLETLLGSGSVAFSDSDRFLVNINEIWDTETGELPGFLGKRGPAEEADIGPIAISKDGRTLAIANEARGIRLFDLVTERELRIFEGNTGATSSLAFSPDGSILVSAGEDRKAIFWNVSDGGRSGASVDLAAAAYSMVFSPTGEFLVIGDIVLDVATRRVVMSLAARTGPDLPVFSPDGSVLVSVDWKQNISVWDLDTGTERVTSLNTKNLSGISRPVFSPDGKFLIYRSALWNVSEGRVANFPGDRGDFDAAAFSGDGKTLALARRVDLEPRKVASAELRSDIEIWDLGSERELAPLRGRAVAVGNISFSRDGNVLAAGDSGGALRLWDLNNVGESTFLNKDGDFIGDYVFSPDGKHLASHQMTGSGYSVKLWDLDTGSAAGEFEAGSGTGRLRFSSTGRYLSYGSSAWDLNTGSKVDLGPLGEFDQIEFSFDETKIAVLEVRGDDLTQQALKIRNVVSGVEIRMENPGESVSEPLAFSPDGRYLAASGSGYPYLIVWDAGSGKVRSVIEDDYERLQAWPAESIQFSPDGRTVAADRGENNPIGLWDTATGEAIGYDKLPAWVRFSGSFAVSRINGRMVRAESDGAGIDLRDADTDETLAFIVAVETSDWAVTTPAGLFDASPGGRKMMHFVLGLEPITLEQMKDVYYVPGLLQKVIKGEPLPKVGLFASKDLYPEVAFEFDERSRRLLVSLRNRGGGIGPVQVLVNSKEVVADARPEGFDPGTNEASLRVSLEGAPFLAGKENLIEVVARNREGSLTNKGTPKGSRSSKVSGDGGDLSAPDVYVIVGGVSDYTGDDLDLRFAAKDAEDFAKAVELGALRLTEDEKGERHPEKVHIRLLTSGGRESRAGFSVPDAKATGATKEEFREAFEDFRGARPEDVFIVYLSGHGTSVNLNPDPARPGGDTYLFLTQEATTTSRDVLVVSGTRRAMTLSSDEIKELMKQNRALKQILILDTCAAGAAVESLVRRRDMPTDQIKALERLKDNTGTYVLMGSAADRVSYEASRYGQGLLTYSLLQGMKGARLRDGGYAYVGDLFSYAQDIVPQLAANIGGVQRPLVIAPEAAGSFPFGRFTEAERLRISLSSPKPQILRPSLQNERLRFDDLRLEQLFAAKLRGISYVSARGQTDAPLVFVDADEMSDAIRPSGSYVSENGVLTIRLVLVKDNQLVGEGITVSGDSNDPEKVVESLIEAFISAVREFQ